MADPQRVRTIFLEAVEHHAPDQWSPFLDRECGEDRDLRKRIEVLLRAHDQANSMLDVAVVPPVETIDQLSTEITGTVIGPYKLLEQIGEGGMGTVWMAQQTEPVKRLVALKLIKAGMDSKQVIARFEAERQALALMDHVNIARVLDAGTTKGEPGGVSPGRPYFVMDLVKGVPITQYCDKHHLTPRQRLELFIPVCQAVQHAHQKGIIHRDLKPSNVLVALYDGKPVPKVIDFGVAKAAGQQLTDKTLVTGFGAIVGTLEYMSPEQAEINQLDIDTRSDIYSLGVLLYELLTGTTPLTKKRVKEAALHEVLRLVREEEPPKPSTRLSESKDSLPSISAQRQTEPAKLTKLVRGELDWIVMKALEKDRNRRYDTANGFAMDVQRYLADEPVLACPPSAGYRFRKFARRNKTGLAVAGLVLFFLVLIGSGVGWAVRDQVAREQENARRLALTELGIRQALDRAIKIRGDLHAALGKRGGVRELLNQPTRWELFIETARAEKAQARGLAARAEEGLNPELIQAVDRLEQQLASDEADFALALRLEKIRLDYGTPRGGDFDWRRAADEYPKALANFGVLTLDAGAVAALVDASPIKEQLLASLDDWAAKAFRLQQINLMERLQAVARRAAPDGTWGNRLRQPVVWRDQKELARLLAEATAAKLSPQLLCVVAMLPWNDQGHRMAWLRRAQERHPADFWLSFLLASGLPDPTEAISYYRVALAIRPTSSVVYNNLGTRLKLQGKPEEAIASFHTALKLTPQFGRPYYNLGVVLKEQGKLEEAIDAWRTAIKLDPEFADAHINLGSALRLQQKLDEAIGACRTAIKLDPKSARAHTALGDALGQQQKLEDAIVAYRTAIKLDPTFARAYANLGEVLRQQQKLQQAIDACRTAIKLDPKDAIAYINLGAALGEQRRFSEAIDALRTAIKLDPKSALAHTNLGIALRYQQKLGEAIDAFRTAIKLDQKSAAAHRGLGAALGEQGKVSEAIDAFHAAIKLDPKSTEVYLNLSIALRLQQRHPEAIDAFRTAIKLDPNLTSGPNNPYLHWAACAAVLAAGGKGIGANKLDSADKVRLRGQALDWLRADLVEKGKFLAQNPATAVPIQKSLQGWLADPDLSGVRDAKGLAALPPDERKAWMKLWRDVREFKDRSEKK